MALLVAHSATDRVVKAPSPTLTVIKQEPTKAMQPFDFIIAESKPNKIVLEENPRKRKWFSIEEHEASPVDGASTKRPKVRPNSKTKVLGVYPSCKC